MLKPVELLIQVAAIVKQSIIDTERQKRFISQEIVNKYFEFKKPQNVDANVSGARS